MGLDTQRGSLQSTPIDPKTGKPYTSPAGDPVSPFGSGLTQYDPAKYGQQDGWGLGDAAKGVFDGGKWLAGLPFSAGEAGLDAFNDIQGGIGFPGKDGGLLGGGGTDLAGGMDKIAQQAYQQGAGQRDWLMDQATGSQGYYNNANAQYDKLTGALTNPGTGEYAFSQMGQDINRQTPIQAYQQQTAGALGQQGAGEQAYGQIQQGLGAPGAFEQGAGAYRDQLSQPGAAGAYMGMVGGKVQAPGQLERNSAGYTSSLSRPGAAEQYQDSTAGVLGQQGNAQGAYNAMGGAYQNDTALEKAYGGLMQGYGQQGMQQKAAPGQAASLNGGQVQDVYAKQTGALDAPGQLEQFAASDAAGTNPYYKQLGDEGRASLNQEYNAGGNFNSGARMAALAKYQGNVDAQAYQARGALQGQAQGATSARMGQQAGLAGQASGEQLGRTQAQAGLLAGADQQGLSRLGAQAGLAGDVSGQSLNYLNSGINAAQGTDASNLARMGLGGQLAQNAQSGELSRIQASAGIDQNAQAGQLARLGLGGQLAQNAGQEQYNRLTAGAGILGQEQSAEQARLGMIGQYGNDAQQQQLARLGLGGQLAGQSTQAGFQQYNDYLDQAQKSQAAGQGRLQQGFGDALALGGQQANLQQGAANSANSAYSQMVSAALGAQTNALSLQAQKEAQDKGNMFQLAGTLAGAYFGGPRGAAAGGAIGGSLG